MGAQLIVQLENMQGEAEKYKTKFADEAQIRRELEDDLASDKKDGDDAALARFDLERRIESLQQETRKRRLEGTNGTTSSPIPRPHGRQDGSRHRNRHLQKAFGRGRKQIVRADLINERCWTPIWNLHLQPSQWIPERFLFSFQCCQHSH